MSTKPSMTDVATLRARARRHVELGAVTPAYQGDREAVLRMLGEALATEIVCQLRYKRHYFAATGIHSQSVKEEFLEHAKQEEAHADKLAQRIVELGGLPDFSPSTLLQRSHAEYVEGATLNDMLRENLVAERVAIESYSEMIAFIGNDDPTTRRILEDILAQEEEHADDLKGLLDGMSR